MENVEYIKFVFERVHALCTALGLNREPNSHATSSSFVLQHNTYKKHKSITTEVNLAIFKNSGCMKVL